MKRSKFSLSHYKLLTCDMGQLIPLTWMEVLPGDTFQQATAMLIRCSPLLAPVMHPVSVRVHHWFVPYRLIWEDFPDFITGGPDGTSLPEHPYCPLGTVNEGSLMDYLGIPPATYSPTLNPSALPFRAYNLIFNNHYRDQDLVTELDIDLTSGSDTTTNRLIAKVSWGKDYFTTCRTDTQKGDDVVVPLADDLPVTGIGIDSQPSSSSKTLFETGATSSRTVDGWDENPLIMEEDPDNTGFPGIFADVSAGGIDISDLRLATAIQRYQERMQKFGSRYVEYLRYLGVKSSDARLNLPEYLGGGRQTIAFSEVLSTDGSNTGDMKGHGISAMRSNRYRRFFEEHGLIMTLLSVIPKSIYAQGLHRGFSREVKEDYFQRELQFIGEQEVYNRELYTEHTTPDGVFGYQARYDEYRSHPSNIAGEFRTTNDHWHYARLFASDPALNSTFINAVPTKRVNASTGTDCLYIMANHSVQARRMISRVARTKLM